MRVGTKIMIPYVILLLLFAGAGVYLTYQYSTQEQILLSTISREQHVNELVDELNAQEGMTAFRLLRYSISKNNDGLQGIVDSDKIIATILSQLTPLVTTTQGKALLRLYEQSGDRQRTLRRAFLRAVTAGADVQGPFERWQQVWQGNRSRLREFTAYKRQLLDRTLLEAELLSIRTRLVLSFSLLAALVLILSASLIHHLFIVRPLRRLTRSMKRMGNGALNIELPVQTSKDEIGELAGAFSTMTEQLRTMYGSLEDQVRTRTQEVEEARKRIEEEVQNVRKFHQAVEFSFDAVFMTSSDGQIVYVNPAWEKLTGYLWEEALGKHPWSFTSVQSDAKVLHHLQHALVHGELFHTENVIVTRKSGSDFDAELTIYPLREKDGSQFYVGVARDITQRKRIDRAKTDFVSLASHQLRTPLTIIRWALGRFHKSVSGLDEHQETLLRTARNATARMAETIETMLTISRVEAEKIQIKPWSIRLLHFLGNLQKDFRPAYEQKRQSFTVDCPEDLLIVSDPNVLREIMANLLNNAIKYTPSSGHIVIRVQPDGGRIRIDVSDSGYGIPPHQAEHIFQKFFRGENIIQNEPDGTGLGLYLVYALVRLIGGDISFVSEENKGTTFSLLLPVTPPSYE